MAASTDPPLSPWAERFPPEQPNYKLSDFVWDYSRHSGLAPELPRFNDPIHYADMTGKLPIRVAPSDEEIDKLFRSEGWQLGSHAGVRTWEAAILNRWIRFSPRLGHISSGHSLGDTGEHAKALQDIFDLESIEVDEGRWEPWLRKDHWLDWVDTSPGEAKKWSVDDPKIWSVLRITVELADRVLKTLIDERHDADLWRDVVPDIIGKEPFEDALVLFSHSQEQYMAQLTGTPCQYDSMTTHSKSEWTQTLNELLHSHLILGGVDGVCCALPGTKATGITLLGIRRLSKLCDGTQLTVGERCMMHVYLSITIVDCQGNNEIGEFFEQQLFGGVSGASEIPIAYSLTQMPSSTRRTVQWFVEGPWSEPSAITRTYHIPPSWHSRLLAEDFWKTSGALRKSGNFFHRPSIVVNETRSLAILNGQWTETQAIYPDPYVETYEEDLRIVRTWEARHNIWRDLRAGWYDDEYDQWRRSPWYYLPCRWQIDMFAEAFANRDEVSCAILSHVMADKMAWRMDQATFNRSLPLVDRLSIPGWVFHCIGTQAPHSLLSAKEEVLGLLMMASLPIREKEVERQDRDRGHTVTVTPSKDAIARGLTVEFQLPQPPAPHKIGDRAGNSELWDQVNGRGQIAGGFSQLDYLTVAADLVSRVTSYAIVHFSWVNALRAAIQRLTRDRQRLQATYPNGHAAQWATDWAFDIPTYDKAVGRYNADGSARFLRFNPASGNWE
ncbi:hypothetical protein F4801DRAFT_595256 [Xylaria longipes]|nr:hypothetical protein F4801DRAFT_595256 [Xylaria longipes]